VADVKWIKIVTDVFDDEKILLIESMPEHDSIIVIWFKLLCLAGKNNNKGVFILNERIAYTDEMLSTIFRRPLNTVRLALKTFEQYGMIELINGVITIPNWGKHQTLDQLENKREYMRDYMAKKRSEQKLLAKGDEVPKILDSCKTNSKSNSKANVSPLDKTKNKKEIKNIYGEFGKVLLTDIEYERLEEKYGKDITDKSIEFLDLHIEEKDYKSKSHVAAIQKWVVDAVKKKQPFNYNNKNNYNIEELTIF